MEVEIRADIRQATRFLNDIEKKAVLPAAVDAVKRSVKFAEVRCVRWYSKRLKEQGRRMTNKKIRERGHVYMVTPKGSIAAARRSGNIGDLLSGSVYINEFREILSIEAGYTEADANLPTVRTFKNRPVIGQPFVFTGRRSGKQIWGKRHPSNRLDNPWKSSQAVGLYTGGKLPGSERAQRVIQKWAERQFYKRFNQQVQRRLDRIRQRAQ